MTRRAMGVGVAALAAGLVIGLQGRAGDEPAKGERPAKADLPTPVVDTHHLMELFNQPLYRSLREQLATAPTGADEWKKVQADARRVAEVANLIAIRKKAAEHKDWKQHAARVQQAGRELAAAAEKREYPAARLAYIGLVQSCNACHKAAAPDHAPTLEPFGKGK